MTGLIHKIDINYDSVEIDDYIVEKPPYVSVSEWNEFWTRVQEVNDHFFEED